MTRRRTIAWILLVAFLLRIAVALSSPGVTSDVENYVRTGRLLAEGVNFYTVSVSEGGSNHVFYPYFPGWAILVAALIAVSEALAVPIVLAVKVPLILADTAICYAVYRVLSTDGFQAPSVPAVSPARAATVYAFNPLTIAVTAQHGQIDSLPFLFLVLAIAAAYAGRWDRSALLLGTGIAFKPVPLFVGLLFLLERPSIRERIRYFTLAALPATVITVPFLLDDAGAVVQSTVGYTAGAHAGWFEVVQLANTATKHALGTAIELPTDAVLTLTKAGFVLAILSISWAYARDDTLSLWEGSLLIVLTFYAVSAGLHPYYFHWAVPLLVVVYRFDWYVLGYVTLGTSVYGIQSLFSDLSALPTDVGGVPTLLVVYGLYLVANALLWGLVIVGITRLLRESGILERGPYARSSP